MTDAEPTRAVVSSTVAWADTDASGHYHFSTVLRWMEAAETALYDQLGITAMFGVIPRAHVDIDYLAPAWFREQIDTRVHIAEVGRSSLTLGFEMTRGATAIARSTCTVVHVDAAGGGSTPWPEQIRERLTGIALP